jgi:hypothetical protein
LHVHAEAPRHLGLRDGAAVDLAQGAHDLLIRKFALAGHVGLSW